MVNHKLICTQYLIYLAIESTSEITLHIASPLLVKWVIGNTLHTHIMVMNEHFSKVLQQNVSSGWLRQRFVFIFTAHAHEPHEYKAFILCVGRRLDQSKTRVKNKITNKQM